MSTGSALIFFLQFTVLFLQNDTGTGWFYCTVYELYFRLIFYFPGYQDISCNFDNNGICNWQQSVNDTFDWSLNNGTTPSQGTGPQQDHTQIQSKWNQLTLDSQLPVSSFMIQMLRIINQVDMIYFAIHLFFTDPNGGTSVGKYPKLIKRD